LIVLTIVFVALLIVVVFGAMKSTDVYKGAVARAKSNPEVVEALGSPLKEGWFLSGHTHVTGSSGEADLAIPISAPKGKGTIYLVATKSAGEWNYSKLVAEIAKTKKRIDLEPKIEL